MSSLSSLSIAVSGLMTSQAALNTTAHNLSNVNTTGYVRQQVLLKDSSYSTVGENATTLFSVGLGVDTQGIRQVRDSFLDMSYREESARYGFYSAEINAVDEIEVVLGETEGESFSDVLNDLWVSINELSKHPDGLETRGTFVQSASMFVDRANMIMEQLQEYQNQLNTNVVETIDEINSIGEQIYELNGVIVQQELNGGNANDYRDARNLLVDQLSELVDVSYREDTAGNMIVKVENIEFVGISGVSEMGTAQAASFSTLVKPIWPHLQSNQDVFNFDTTISTEADNDKGYLKGLLLTRGDTQADWTDMLDQTHYEEDVKPSIIMNAQAQFDNLIHGIVTMINDIVTPNTTGSPATLDTDNAPYGLNGEQGIEIFVRENVDRYNTTGEYNEEDATNSYSLYSAGKITINPDILSDYNNICLSSVSGNDGDNSVVEEILGRWEETFSTLEPGLSAELNFNDYYNEFVVGIGDSGYTVGNIVSNQELMISQIDNQRSGLSGVSSDEELGNMIKYQHAYNAAAKVVTIVDSMIEHLVTNTGLVGR